jgi:hypothetical protein
LKSDDLDNIKSETYSDGKEEKEQNFNYLHPNSEAEPNKSSNESLFEYDTSQPQSSEQITSINEEDESDECSIREKVPVVNPGQRMTSLIIQNSSE